MSDPLAAALAWAARGFRVFPLAENSKDQPLFRAYSDLATTDAAQIKRWWSDPLTGIIRGYNIGVATTGLCVVDVDNKHGRTGTADYLGLDGHFGTLVVRTPSGGFHCYFSTPHEVAGLVKNVAEGLDIRAYGNYVLAPGSTIDGRAYTLEVDQAVAEVPDAILARCRPPGERRSSEAVPAVQADTAIAVKMATDYLQRASPAIEGAGGNSATFKTAARVRDFGIAEATCFELLWEHYNPRCAPAWSPEELRALVQHAYLYGQEQEGAKHPAVYFGSVVVPPAPKVWLLPDTPGRPAHRFGNAIPFAELKPRPWVVRRMLEIGEVSAFIAPGGVGKSLLILEIAIFLALGVDVFGFRNAYGSPRRSVIFNAEDNRNESSMRLAAACVALGVDQHRVIPWIDLISGKELTPALRLVVIDEYGRPQPNKDDLIYLCATAYDDPECVMLGIDPLSKVHALQENDNVAMGLVIDTLSAAAAAAHVAIALAAHTAKPAAGMTHAYVGNSDAARGAGAIRDSCRNAFTLASPTEEDVTRYGMTPETRRRYVRVDDAKMNRGLLGEAPAWLWKETVPLPTGEDVGAFVPGHPTDQTDVMRSRLGEALRAEIWAGGSAHIGLGEAVLALRRNDPLQAQLDARVVRQRLEQMLVTPIELVDGLVVKLVMKGAQKAILLDR